MSIGGTLWGDGVGTFRAGGDMTGAGGLAFGQAINITAGGSVLLAQGIHGANSVSVQSGNDLTLGALTAVGNATLTSTAGSVSRWAGPSRWHVQRDSRAEPNGIIGRCSGWHDRTDCDERQPGRGRLARQ